MDELQNKLGLKPGMQAYIIHAPSGYEECLSSPIKLSNSNKLIEDSDWIQAFYLDKRLLEKEVGALKNCMKKNGQLWICWPKKSSKIKSDLSDDYVRQIGIRAGLVDIKVVAINETWSGLKFVYRVSDR